MALDALHSSYEIPSFVVLEGLKLWHGAVNSGGNAEKVALYVSMFSHSLRLPFCRPIRDVLDFLGLALAQVHPNAWRILTSCCVAWHMVLESIREEYLDLTAREFLFTHAVCALEGNIYNFHSLGSRHVTPKQWQSKFFFTSGERWGFLLGEVAPQAFFIGPIGESFSIIERSGSTYSSMKELAFSWCTPGFESTKRRSGSILL